MSADLPCFAGGLAATAHRVVLVLVRVAAGVPVAGLPGVALNKGAAAPLDVLVIVLALRFSLEAFSHDIWGVCIGTAYRQCEQDQGQGTFDSDAPAYSHQSLTWEKVMSRAL